MNEQELMQFELIRLLFDYSNNNKLVDEKFIDKLLEIIVNKSKLKEYVKDYSIIDEINLKNAKPEIIAAEYDINEKKITISKKGVDDALQHGNQYRYKFVGSDIEQCAYMNLIVTQIILHELEHARQQKIITTGNDMEAKILRQCSNTHDRKTVEKLVRKGEIDIISALIYSVETLKQYIKNYTDFYIYAPHERLAEIKSFNQIIESLNYIKSYVPRLINFQEACLLERMLMGYDENTYSPTITFLSKLKKQEQLKQFDWYSDNPEEALKLSKQHYSLEER